MTTADRKPEAVPGVAPAPADTEAMATSSTVSFLRSRLDRLQEFDGSALCEEWRRLHRSEPPRISRDLLARALAYRLQELEFGGLPKWARQSLAGSAADPDEAGGAARPKPAQPRLKPGARLVREWHGRTHSVIVLDDAFEFEGRRYRSLTSIAREITGAHWSGPRFFGLAKRRARAELDAPTRQDGPEEASGLAPSGPCAPAIGARRDLAESESVDACRRGHRVKESADG
jgi:Protein of unknown function (DUF2924)